MKQYLKEKFPKLYNKYIEFHSLRRNLHYSSLAESRYPEELAKVYKNMTGQELDWNNLRTYNEKMQWAKLYDKDPIKTTLTDKYLVREWIKNTIGEQYLIPIYGVWDSFEEIDFDKLPNKFVLKTNHGSGTNLIVKDKLNFDRNEAKKKFEKWMKVNFAFENGFEMQYKDIKPKIIAEKYIEDFDGDLKDYKFLCFNGKVNFCWVDTGRYSDHRRNVYNLDWELQEWQQFTYQNTDTPVSKPDNFELMVDLVKKLCHDFMHVRIDLYNSKGKIYFGEMTFTNGSGFEVIHPYNYNLMLGDMWELPISKDLNK